MQTLFYEPKPGVLKTFSKADLYLSDSSGLDQVWLPRFLSVNKKIEMVYISSGVSWMQESEDHHHGHHHDHHHHGEDHHENKHKHEDHDENHHESASLDPHLWTSPKQVIKVAENVLSALIKKDAASKSIMNLDTNFYRKMDIHRSVYRKRCLKSLKNVGSLLCFTLLMAI